MQKKPLSYFYLLILLLVTGSLVLLLIRTKPVKHQVFQDIPPLRVELTRVRKVDIQPVVRITGDLQPRRKALLHFELAGQLIARDVEPGQAVTRDQRLLRVADGDYRDAVAEARARLEQEQAAVERDRRLLEYVTRNRELQAREVERLRHLRKDSLSSRSTVDEAVQRLLQQQSDEEQLRYSVATAAARIELGKRVLRRAERNLRRTALKAPFAGIVNDVRVQEGDYVTPNQPVLELLQTGMLDLYLEVNGATAAALHRGQEVTVHVTGEARQGKIVALQSDPDPQTATHAIRIRVSAGRVLPGTLAEAELPLNRLDDALVVPVSAVLRENGVAYVFTTTSGVLRRIPVETRARDGDRQVITGAVKAGDKVVARDVAVLRDGARVEYQGK